MVIDLKNCEHCAKLMQRRVFPSGAVEGPTMYRKRRWCSLQCANVGLRQRPIAERFWGKVEKTETCWLWRGAVGADGYGNMHVSKERHSVGAHRVSWFLHEGVWPTLDVLHRCDEKLCVRHDHHYLGTDVENARDRVVRGRQAPGLRGFKNGNAKLRAKQVLEIKRRADEGEHPEDLARAFSVGRTTIYRVMHGVRLP